MTPTNITEELGLETTSKGKRHVRDCLGDLAVKLSGDFLNLSINESMIYVKEAYKHKERGIRNFEGEWKRYSDPSVQLHPLTEDDSIGQHMLNKIYEAAVKYAREAGKKEKPKEDLSLN